MSWNSEKIRDLRLRLGLSPGDLARWLQIESSEVRDWEGGVSLPADGQAQQLDFLENRALACADEMACQPLAEQLLHDDELGQINLDQVKSRFSENN